MISVGPQSHVNAPALTVLMRPPGSAFLSKTLTRQPFAARRMAVESPPSPAPTITAEEAILPIPSSLRRPARATSPGAGEWC